MLSWLRRSKTKPRRIKASRIITGPMGRSTVLPGVSPQELHESLRASALLAQRARDERADR